MTLPGRDQGSRCNYIWFCASANNTKLRVVNGDGITIDGKKRLLGLFGIAVNSLNMWLPSCNCSGSLDLLVISTGPMQPDMEQLPKCAYLCIYECLGFSMEIGLSPGNIIVPCLPGYLAVSIIVVRPRNQSAKAMCSIYDENLPALLGVPNNY